MEMHIHYDKLIKYISYDKFSIIYLHSKTKQSLYELHRCHTMKQWWAYITSATQNQLWLPNNQNED
jgi:hypothetical protein